MVRIKSIFFLILTLFPVLINPAEADVATSSQAATQEVASSQESNPSKQLESELATAPETPAKQSPLVFVEQRLVTFISDSSQPTYRNVEFLKLNGELTVLKSKKLSENELAAAAETLNQKISFVADMTQLEAPVDITELLNTADGPISAYTMLKMHKLSPASNLFLFAQRTGSNAPVLMRIYNGESRNDLGREYNAQADIVWDPSFGTVTHGFILTSHQLTGSHTIAIEKGKKTNFTDLIKNTLPNEMKTILETPINITNRDKVRSIVDASFVVRQMGNVTGWMVKLPVTVTPGEKIPSAKEAPPKFSRAATPKIQFILKLSHQEEEGSQPVLKTQKVPFGQAYKPLYSNHDGSPIIVEEVYMGFGPDFEAVYQSQELNGQPATLWYTNKAEAQKLFTQYYEEHAAKNKALTRARAERRLTGVKVKSEKEAASNQSRAINTDGSFSLRKTDKELGFKNKLVGWFIGPFKIKSEVTKPDFFVKPELITLPNSHGLIPDTTPTLPAEVKPESCKLLVVAQSADKTSRKAFFVAAGHKLPVLEEGYELVNEAFYGFGVDLDGRLSQRNKGEKEFWVDGYSAYIYDKDIQRGYELQADWIASESPKPPTKSGEQYIAPTATQGALSTIGEGFSAIGSGIAKMFT